MIEHFSRTKMLRGDNTAPAMLVQSRAYVECGCSVFVGTWLHNREAGVAAAPCSPEHTDLAREVNERYVKTLDNPTDKLAVEVADEVLTDVVSSQGA